MVFLGWRKLFKWSLILIVDIFLFVSIFVYIFCFKFLEKRLGINKFISRNIRYIKGNTIREIFVCFLGREFR